MRIGHYQIKGKAVLAPMAGVTDRPFRVLCRKLGAAMAASEMLASDPGLRNSRKSLLRADHKGEPEPRIIQIAGAVPEHMAEAARYNANRGAQVIDINMGCPAKKVCNRLAGSALLGDEGLVRDILDAVVKAVGIPVTLKIRTGTDRANRNGVRIAELAEDAGIQALAVHGRTRTDAYRGQAEHDTARAIRRAISLPLIVNGDIDSPRKAADVLERTGADAVMIGRAAQGRPWIFREINYYLETGRLLPGPPADEIRDIFLEHLRHLHAFYGLRQGIRVARKHIGWYLGGRPDGEAMRRVLVRVNDADEQLRLAARYFDGLAARRVA